MTRQPRLGSPYHEQASKRLARGGRTHTPQVISDGVETTHGALSSIHGPVFGSMVLVVTMMMLSSLFFGP